DQVADRRLGSGVVENARIPQNLLVGGRADHQARLLHARQRRELARDAHQHDGIEKGRPANLVEDHAHPTSIVSAKAMSACSKHLSGAFTMPAPTWPTPGWRWAIPVLMVGTRDVSTTRRMSMPVGTPAKSMAGIVQARFRPTVISAIARV